VKRILLGELEFTLFLVYGRESTWGSGGGGHYVFFVCVGGILRVVLVLVGIF
jgi:hypothetical protein